MTFFKLILILAVLNITYSIRAVHNNLEAQNLCSLPANDLKFAGLLSYKSLTTNVLYYKVNYKNLRQADISLLNDKIIINEIYADPNPSNGLPTAEYVELFNASDHDIEMVNWKITDGVSKAEIPLNTLHAKEYLLLCKEENQSLFSPNIQIAGLSTWPSLNNTGDNIALIDDQDIIIDQVNYDLNWYQNDDKSKGGWSLERKDPNFKCQHKRNWSASTHILGGTPGKENSIFEIIVDLILPSVDKIRVLDENHIQLWFNEPLNVTASQTMSIDFEPSLDIDSIYQNASTPSVIEIILLEAIIPKIEYSVGVKNVQDCSLNLLNDITKLDFGYPLFALPGQVIVNEILFNPKTGGKDFVEIHNPTDLYIDLNKIILINSKLDKTDRLIIDEYLAIPPKGFIVFTEDKQILLSDYPFSTRENIYQVDNLPALPDDEGSLSLYQQNGILIDSVNYKAKWHHPLIQDNEGVSLERIDSEVSGFVSSHWHSAASNVGHATPGFANSQHLLSPGLTKFIQIAPQIVSPNNDGVDDFTRINYILPSIGYNISIGIYDINGYLIRQIANNQLVGSQGFFQWNGMDDQGQPVKPGYVIVLSEAFNSQGDKLMSRNTLVVAWEF